MPTQTFTTGNDTFTVSAAGTYDLDFLAGDDLLTVNGGTSTTAHMGDGNDKVKLLLGLATVFGDAGLDKFDIWASDATVFGGGDADTINIRGGTGVTASGDLGADRFNIFADTSGISLDGGDGNDTFYGYSHAVAGTILGGAGNDYFALFMAGTTLAGGLGNDIYRVTVGSAATFVENVGEGTDSIQLARGQSYTLPDNIEKLSVQGFSGSTAVDATITGNALDNAIISHNNNETIDGLGGDDRITSNGGNDVVHGGEGNDVLVGGTGTDQLFGDAGNDTLRGVGAAAMSGGTGNDFYYVDGLDDVVTENSGEGTDTVRTFVSGYTLTANVENGIIQNTGAGMTLTGNALNNVLTGNHGNDTLNGGDGNDTLQGGDGNDILNGDDGDDSFYGGAGADLISAEGSGGDVAVYKLVAESTVASFDILSNFHSVDTVDVSAIDANTTIAGNQDFDFHVNQHFGTGTAGEMWYVQDNSDFRGPALLLYGDVDGGGADFFVKIFLTDGMGDGPAVLGATLIF